MKSVLLSIKPYYVFLIIAHKMGWDIPQEKTIEVRKDFPKDIEWNKVVHIYCSKDKKSFNLIPAQYQPLMEKFVGRVIGEFVCDKIEDFYCASVPYQKENNLGYGRFIDNGVYKVNGWHEGIVFERNDRYIDSMLKNKELDKMCLSAQELFDYIGTGKHLYGWHISGLKIYDKPKPLTSFCKTCRIEWKNCPCCEFYSTYTGCCMNCVKRPPESWFYVESLVE